MINDILELKLEHLSAFIHRVDFIIQSSWYEYKWRQFQSIKDKLNPPHWYCSVKTYFIIYSLPLQSRINVPHPSLSVHEWLLKGSQIQLWGDIKSPDPCLTDHYQVGTHSLVSPHHHCELSHQPCLWVCGEYSIPIVISLPSHPYHPCPTIYLLWI